MTNPRKRSASLNSENRIYPEDPKDMDEIFQFLDIYMTLSRPSSPPCMYRSEFDKSLFPFTGIDLRKEVLSIDQFNCSMQRGLTLLTAVEERLQKATSESDGPKYEGTWEEISNDMLKASSEVFVANKIYEKLRNSKSNCIFCISDRRAEVNKKWFSIKNLFKAYKKNNNL